MLEDSIYIGIPRPGTRARSPVLPAFPRVSPAFPSPSWQAACQMPFALAPLRKRTKRRLGNGLFLLFPPSLFIRSSLLDTHSIHSTHSDPEIQHHWRVAIIELPNARQTLFRTPQQLAHTKDTSCSCSCSCRYRYKVENSDNSHPHLMLFPSLFILLYKPPRHMHSKQLPKTKHSLYRTTYISIRTYINISSNYCITSFRFLSLEPSAEKTIESLFSFSPFPSIQNDRHTYKQMLNVFFSSPLSKCMIFHHKTKLETNRKSKKKKIPKTKRKRNQKIERNQFCQVTNSWIFIFCKTQTKNQKNKSNKNPTHTWTWQPWLGQLCSRVSVMRGQVITPQGLGIVGIRVSVDRDSRFGFTLTRQGGWWVLLYSFIYFINILN